MSELRKVPVWVWVLAGLAVVYRATVTVGAKAPATAQFGQPVQAGGPPAPYAVPADLTHSCPVSWTGGRWSWSPNRVGEWLYACG